MLLSVGHLLHNFKRKCITCSHYSHAAKEKKENIVAPDQLLKKIIILMQSSELFNILKYLLPFDYSYTFSHSTIFQEFDSSYFQCKGFLSLM